MAVGVKKKAKPSPKGGKLLAEVKKAVKAAVKKLVFGKQSGLAEAFEASQKAAEQTDANLGQALPVTLTGAKGTVHPIGVPLTCGPDFVKEKLKDAATKQGFIDKLTAASPEIFENTKKGNKAKLYAGGPDGEVFEINDMEDLKLAGFKLGAGGFVHPNDASGSMYGALTNPKISEADIQAYETTMKKGAMPQSLVVGDWHAVAKARKDAMEHYTMMVHALVGAGEAVILIPKRKLSDKAEAYRRRLRVWWRKAHKRFCILAAKVRAKKKVEGSGSIFQQPYIPVYTTPPIIPVGKEVIAEVDAKLKSLVGFKASELVDAMGKPLYPGLKEQEAELTDWMNHTAKAILFGVHFEPFDKTVLLKVRGMIEKHFFDTVFSGGVGPPALFKMLGKQQVVHRTGLRFWHYLEGQYGKCSIEQVQLFNQVFPSEGLPVTFNGPDKIITKQDIADWMIQVAQIIFDFIHWQHPCKEVLLEVRKYIENVYDEDLVPKLPHAYIVDKMIPKAGVVHRIGARVRHMLIEKYGELPDEADDLFAEVFPLPGPPDALVAADFADLMAPIAGPKAPTFVKSAEELKVAFGESDMDNVQAKLVATLLKNTQEYVEAHPEAVGYGPMDGVGIAQPMKTPHAKVFHLDWQPGPDKNKLTSEGLATLDRFGVALKGTG